MTYKSIAWEWLNEWMNEFGHVQFVCKFFELVSLMRFWNVIPTSFVVRYALSVPCMMPFMNLDADLELSHLEIPHARDEIIHISNGKSRFSFLEKKKIRAWWSSFLWPKIRLNSWITLSLFRITNTKTSQILYHRPLSENRFSLCVSNGNDIR